DAQAAAPVSMASITTPATRQINSVAVSAPSPVRVPSDLLVAVEVRPTLALDGGLRLSMGFRAGSSDRVADRGVATADGVRLTGADLSVGYQHPEGPVRPFAEARLGFNGYSLILDGAPHNITQFRLDAVLGVRLYLGETVYLAGAAFAGWGDRYGGSISIGLD